MKGSIPEERNDRQQRGQSIIIVAVALVALIIFAAIAVDVANTYVHRRTAQNAADAAALAGARDLARQLNECAANPNCFYEGDDENFWMYSSEGPIQVAMNDFAERNGTEDTDGVPANAVNDNVVGYYLDESGMRIGGDNPIVIGASDIVHPDARGVEAIAHAMAPSFFGGIIGLDGLPVQAESAVVFVSGAVCADTCVMPIATLTQTFELEKCYNIWDGAESGSFGWLHWQFQQEDEACKCSAVCLEENMDPLTCASGRIEVDTYVASDSGISNKKQVRDLLEYYIDELEPFTVIIYDTTACVGGKCDECAGWKNGGPRGLGYHVVGFAKFQLLGYSLATGGGGGQSYGDDGENCEGPDETGGNRLTGVFMGWVEGEVGDCESVGTIIAPRVVK